ncbi:hypothetical protein [Solimonas marina]|uniref:Uncharacterized protein n=1 Tax=Solimonas marina TaxID=2714601 RepID=A0A969W9V2_9GAMM|nr:hypothetical protein [Solimonas marina]NKF21586.1 hypothetical protein [Solimonas marina]
MNNELPLYQCHKRVRAAKIEHINVFNENGDAELICEGGYETSVAGEWLARVAPPGAAHSLIGGYIVQYGDGYASWSPAAAFEDGYTLIEQPKPAEPQPPVQAPPVDRSAQQLSSGEPVDDEHRMINPATGLQKDYVVLTAEERAKGFVRPVRNTYVHVGHGAKFDGPVQMTRGSGCGAATTISRDIAETYARDPKFYSGTFCIGCRTHLPLSEFVWDGTNEVVGS